MGEDAADLRERDAGARDQVVDDADGGLGDDRQLEVLEVVVIFVDGAGEGVLDGDDRAGGAPFLEVAEDVFEALAGENGGVGAVWIRASKSAGELSVVARHSALGERRLTIRSRS